MDDSAGHFRKRNSLIAAALFLCCANVSAQNYSPPATVAEAHEFLGSTFQRYSIGYVVWHGNGLRDNRKGRVEYYGGRDCYSEVGTVYPGSTSRAFAVDWSLVSGVEMSGAEAIYVSGQLMRASQDSGGRREANFHLYFPNASVSGSVLHALEFLRSSCQRRSKFD
jgi:hypothetical protein